MTYKVKTLVFCFRALCINADAQMGTERGGDSREGAAERREEVCEERDALLRQGACTTTQHLHPSFAAFNLNSSEEEKLFCEDTCSSLINFRKHKRLCFFLKGVHVRASHTQNDHCRTEATAVVVLHHQRVYK